MADRWPARWLERFADSRMGEAFTWRQLNKIVIRRGPRGVTRVAKARLARTAHR
jgi:hypothetical protein